MKTIFALFLAAALHAESAPADEPSSAPAAADTQIAISPGAISPGGPPSPAAVEPHAESAASGGSSSPSEPAPSPRGLPPQAGGGAIGGNDGNGGNGGQLELVDNPPPSSRAAKPRAPAAARPASRGVPRSPCRAKPQVPCPPLHAEVSLVDGSSIKGVFRQRFLPALSPNLGRIRIDLRAVESIAAVAPQNGATAGFRVAFKNGDRLTVRFPDGLRFLPFDTLLGRVRLPLRAVSSLAFAGDETDALLYYCTFDDAQSIARPAAGPAGRFLGGSFVPGKNGKALRVEADTPAFESMLPKGFFGPEGCLEFWAKIEGDNPRYVDGGDPLFVSLYDERGAITLLQFAANNGFARGGLGGAFVSWPFGTIPHYVWSMEYRKVLGENWADWHHYAMSWKAEGFGDGSFVKVFVDGRPQLVLGGVDDDKVPARLADYVNHAHDLGIPWSTARSADHRRSKKPFLVDDLKIWSAPKTEFNIR